MAVRGTSLADRGALAQVLVTTPVFWNGRALALPPVRRRLGSPLIEHLEALAMSKTKKIWLFLALVLMLTGCGAAASKNADSPARGGGQPAESAESAPGSAGFAADAPPSKSAAGDEAPPPPASQPGAPPRSASTDASGGAPSKSEAPRRAEPRPETRPGLGTEWGETRTSRVHDVSFVRDSSRPFATAVLNYNDRRGVDAMANAKAREVRRDSSAAGGAVTIQIRDASGNPLEAVHVGDRTLVVGQAGQRYSIVLTNNTNHRFESVVTVDGLDVINGRPGTLENRGYVLMPFATLEIEGFRQSNAAVAAFRFAAVSESYAAQMGSARNVGVIGIALFGERGDSFVDERELRLRDSATPFPADPRFAQPPRR